MQSVPFKLPEGLAAGSYRVVSDQGRVARLTIDREAGTPRSSADFIAITTETERWYFIRLKSEAATARRSFSTVWNDTIPSVPNLPMSFAVPIANRKFDFTGYVPAAVVDVPPASGPATEIIEPAGIVVQQAERPAPPELPSPL